MDVLFANKSVAAATFFPFGYQAMSSVCIRVKVERHLGNLAFSFGRDCSVQGIRYLFVALDWTLIVALGWIFVVNDRKRSFP